MLWYFKTIGRLLLTPVRWALAIRSSMTGASATLLLVWIVSLNVVWGYPWTGLFASCATMLLVGFLLNRIFRPRLEARALLPSHAVMDSEFAATIHLKHHGQFPTFDIHVHPAIQRRRRRWVVRIVRLGEAIGMIDGKGRGTTQLVMKGSHRGVHRLPPIEVVSMFPFSLFRSVSRVPLRGEIAVTPKPMTDNESSGSQEVLRQLDLWTERWQAQGNHDYIGSREYVTGMPVRRWDFRSWARMGRPVVCEFQTPALRIAHIIVDTALEPSYSPSEGKAAVEWMLRHVASAVDQWQRGAVNARMFVTSESLDLTLEQEDQSPSDPRVLLIQLAKADFVTPDQADSKIEAACLHSHEEASLLFTTRHQPATNQASSSHMLHVLRVDLPNQELASASGGGNRSKPLAVGGTV